MNNVFIETQTHLKSELFFFFTQFLAKTYCRSKQERIISHKKCILTYGYIIIYLIVLYLNLRIDRWRIACGHWS